jgi:hypothetical protein
MKPHKWAKEIKAWADGAKIEWTLVDKPQEWICCNNQPGWGNDNLQFRIKPQPKEPQYLYAYWNHIFGKVDFCTKWNYTDSACKLIGKIKLEDE